jgi:hypothetical protein
VLAGPGCVLEGPDGVVAGPDGEVAASASASRAAIGWAANSWEGIT